MPTKAKKQVSFLDPNMPPMKSILLLAWPAVLEQMMITLVQYVDTAMVGSLGANATAAIAVCTSTTWLLGGLMAAVGVGFSVQVARNLGAGDGDAARQVTRQALLAVGALGIGITLIMQVIGRFLPVWLGAQPEIVPEARSYILIVTSVYLLNMSSAVFSAVFRCAGDTKTPMLLNTATNVLNVIGNFLLIFPSREIQIMGRTVPIWGAGWGVRGAAVSTALSTAFIGLMMLLCVFVKNSPIQLTIKGNYRPNRIILMDALTLGIPAALERVTLSFGQIVSTSMVSGLGTVPLAANHLAVTAESISYLPANGFSTAATTLVAQSLGAGQKERAHKFGKTCTWLAVGMMAAGGVILFTCSRLLIRIFTSDPAVVELGSGMLKIVSFAEPFFALSIVIFGVLRGAGDTKWPFYISLAGMWGIRLGLAWVLAYPAGLGLAGIWLGMAADLVVRGILCVVRFRRGSWMNTWDKT